MFITDEMRMQEFLSNDENFYPDRADTAECIDDLKIGTEVCYRIPIDRRWTLEGPYPIVGYRVDTHTREVFWPNFDGVIERVFEQGNLFWWSLVVKRFGFGSTFRFHTQDQFDVGGTVDELRQSMNELRPDTRIESCKRIRLGDILRPQTPPVKQMLTSVNLHRLAYGHSMLPKTVDEEELRAHYKAMKEKSDVHHA